MARDIGIGDEVMVTATVLKRVSEDRVSVSIPSYNFPHSICDRTAKNGAKIELGGEVTHVDEGKVTVKGEVGLVTVNADTVRLVKKYRPPTRRTPLRDEAD